MVSKAIGFLSSVVKPVRHKELFQNPEILKNICEKIILPNMTLRGMLLNIYIWIFKILVKNY